MHTMQLRSHTKKNSTSRRPNVVHRCLAFQVSNLNLGRLKSFKDVENFHCFVKHQTDATKKIDIIEVLDRAGDLACFKAIRAILRRTKNITCLTLCFSFEPELHILPIGNTVVFKHLTVLNVNIPHATLEHFLNPKHSQITDLVLGSCNTPTCPLVGCRLPRLQRLVCPPGCVQALTSADSPVTQLHIIHDTAQDASFPLPRLFDSCPIRTSFSLTELHLDFDHTATGLQGGLLQRISEAAPVLEVLRLTESPFSDKSPSETKPLPWDNAEDWENGLRSLLYLRRLLLRTWRTLEETPRSDDGLVRNWLISSPPNLEWFVVWTKAFAEDMSERIVTWHYEGDLQWRRYSVQPGEDRRVDRGAFV